MKRKILYLAIGMAFLICLVVGLYLVSEKEAGVEFPIDSKEEAIRYAKTDPDVVEFINQHSKVNAWADFDSSTDVWAVGFEAIGPTDIWFEIHFKPDGTIISKGRGVI